MKHQIAWLRVAGTVAAASLVMGCSSGLRVTTDLGTQPVDETGLAPDVPTNFDPVDPGPGPDGNQPPVADAGDDFIAVVSSEVVLDASNSFDPDGDPLTYTWVLTPPPDSVSFLINETRIEASLFLDRPGVYLVDLQVSDGFASSRDTIEVTAEVLNAGPVAVAGPDQNVRPGMTVFLEGTDSYDPDGEQITFEWDLVQVPPASSAVLSSSDSALTNFVADRSGTYIAELIVSDGSESSLPDQVIITASESGGSSGGSCLSCSSANLTGGGIASGLGALGIPLLALWWWRRRELARP